MCQLCDSFGLKSEPTEKTMPAERVTKNADGTYTLRLTETELMNLTLRLALSVLGDRRN